MNEQFDNNVVNPQETAAPNTTQKAPQQQVYQQPYGQPYPPQYGQPYAQQNQPPYQQNQYEQPYIQYPNQNPYYYNKKPKTAGFGFGVTSMIMGIFALIFTIGFITEIKNNPDTTDLFFNAIFIILATVFGCISIAKGYKGMSMAGLIMAIMSVLFSVVILFVYFSASSASGLLA